MGDIRTRLPAFHRIFTESAHCTGPIQSLPYTFFSVKRGEGLTKSKSFEACFVKKKYWINYDAQKCSKCFEFLKSVPKNPKKKSKNLGGGQTCFGQSLNKSCIFWGVHPLLRRLLRRLRPSTFWCNSTNWQNPPLQQNCCRDYFSPQLSNNFLPSPVLASFEILGCDDSRQLPSFPVKVKTAAAAAAALVAAAAPAAAAAAVAAPLAAAAAPI